jgi:hypothetical protein
MQLEWCKCRSDCLGDKKTDSTGLRAVYTYPNQRTICSKSDGDPNICTIRKYSVYTRYDLGYESVYESDSVHLSL